MLFVTRLIQSEIWDSWVITTQHRKPKIHLSTNTLPQCHHEIFNSYKCVAVNCKFVSVKLFFYLKNVSWFTIGKCYMISDFFLSSHKSARLLPTCHSCQLHNMPLISSRMVFKKLLHPTHVNFNIKQNMYIIVRWNWDYVLSHVSWYFGKRQTTVSFLSLFNKHNTHIFYVREFNPAYSSSAAIFLKPNLVKPT